MMTEKNKQALTIGVIVGILLAGLVAYYYFMMVRPEVIASQKRQDGLKVEIKKNQDRLAELNAYLADKNERERLVAELEAAKRRLPSDPEAIEFLDILRTSLTRTGVTFTYVGQKPMVSRGLYREIPYDVRASARYHEFGQFLNLIECHPDRFMRINAFTVTKNDKRPSIHPISVGISTFMFASN